MNISRLNIHKLLSPLIFLLLPLWSFAQVEYFELLVNESVVHEFVSCGNAGQITQISSNGTHYLNGEQGETYGNSECTSNPNVLEYVPDSNFIGSDTMVISYWASGPFGPIYTTTILVFNVVDVIVIAVDDYATTSINDQIIIVLSTEVVI